MITRPVLKFAAPLPRIEDFQRYLFIGPHPDDIEIGAGATAAKLIRQGKQVCFLICTDGRFGLSLAPAGTTPDMLSEIRMREAEASAGVLGVHDVRFLNLHDGAGYTMDEMIRGMARTVEDFQPDMIFAPDPFVASECHPDHINTGEAARQIACFAPYGAIMEGYGAGPAPVKAIGFYMTARPNRFVGTRGLLPVQFSAIFDCHKSQYPDGCREADAIRAYLRLRSADFGLRSFHLGAEGFRVLGTTHMHCLPEAGL